MISNGKLPELIEPTNRLTLIVNDPQLKFSVDVTPGDVTIDGVVLAVQFDGVSQVVIVHRSVNYKLLTSDTVQVYAKVVDAMTRNIINAAKQEGILS